MPDHILFDRNGAAAMALALIAFAGLAAPAAARPDTRTMTCEQARAFVRQSGAAVMSTGQYTYDRIVSGYGYCDRGEETELKTAATTDNPKCRTGYICRDRIVDEPFWWRTR